MNWAAAYNWVESYLRGLTPGAWVAINDIDIRDKLVFIECAKQYIDWYKDAEFSDDYTQIKRIELIT